MQRSPAGIFLGRSRAACRMPAVACKGVPSLAVGSLGAFPRRCDRVLTTRRGLSTVEVPSRRHGFPAKIRFQRRIREILCPETRSGAVRGWGPRRPARTCDEDETFGGWNLLCEGRRAGEKKSLKTEPSRAASAE